MKSRTLRLGLPALLLAAAAGCGSSRSGTGTVSVHLVDAPGDYQHIWLQILEVQIHGQAQGWKTLATRAPTDPLVDLLSLRNGVVFTLVDRMALPADRYTQLRLVLGSDNAVTVEDATGAGVDQPLTVPSGQQTGVKFVCNVDVPTDGAKDIYIDIDGHRSIFAHGTGVPGKYILRPVVRCVEGAAAGSISGVLSTGEGEGGQVGGVVVTAQTLDPVSGKATIVQHTETDSEGSYKLDLLPLTASGVDYYVVTEAKSWLPQASAPIALSTSHPTETWDGNASFAMATTTGTVSGTITWTGSTPDGEDEVLARQSLAPGGSGLPRTFIVRDETVTGTASPEPYSIPLLPTGATYTVSAVRHFADDTTSESSSMSSGAPASGVTLSFP
jgi:hypothetical protein